MKTPYAKRMCLYYMKKFELDKWQFEWFKGTATFGECDIDNKKIRLSLPLTEVNNIKTVRDIVLHEIAHALSPKNHNHSDTWKKICHKIGAKPEPFWDEDKVKQPKK